MLAVALSALALALALALKVWYGVLVFALAPGDSTDLASAPHLGANNLNPDLIGKIQGFPEEIKSPAFTLADLCREAYDVILLNFQMPVMDGLEAGRKIRGLGLAKRPFIVALTANVFQEDRAAASAAGMDDYLSKPITLARLREMFASIGKTAALPN